MAQVSDVEVVPRRPEARSARVGADRWLPQLAAGSPELVAAAVAGFSIGPMILLLAGTFHAALAIPLGLVGAAIAMWLCGLPAEPASRRALAFTAAAAVLALAWFLYNQHYYAQDVYATRDPATYGIAGRWLMDNPSLNVPVHTEIFGTPNGSTLDASGFQVARRGILHAQGNHLLPVLISLAGSAFGVTALLKANIAIGALALFVFFGLARRIVGEPFALLAMATFAVSLPFIYVTRDSYSEPLMLLFLVGGLALLERAVTSWRVADFALAGFVVACAAMVRIDSYVALLAVILAAFAVAGLASADRRRAAAVRAGALILGAAGPMLLGWLDLTWLSALYYRQLHSQVTAQLAAMAVLLVVGPAIAWLGWRPSLRARFASDASRRRLAIGAVMLVVGVFAFLATRPWWQVTRREPPNINLENMQRDSHVAIDGTRLYNEQSVNWQAMYFGWPTVVLAVAGYALLLAAVIRRRTYALVGTLTMAIIVSALYLWDCQIVADQPWASRRFVPVVMPLLLIAAAAALRALWTWQRAQPWPRMVVIVAAVLAVAVPLSVTIPMASTRDEAGQLAQLKAICTAVGPHGAVVELDRSVKAGYGQAIRSYCGVPTIAVVEAVPSQLAAIRTSVIAHGRTLFALSQDPTNTHYATSGDVPPFSTVTTQRWPNVINQPPTERTHPMTILFLSTVDAAGLAHPVPPAK